jgi:uncharacterized SAM-binding protein YcdF (DUF218 family)
MFFTLTKIVQSLILPPSGLLILMAIGFLIVGKKRILGVLCIASGYLLLYGMCISPVSNALIQPLESMYVPFVVAKNIDVQAIVVLSGGARDASGPGLGPVPDSYSLERLVYGVALYRKLLIPLMLIGGSGDPGRPDLLEAEAMARTAISIGVPAKDIVVESSVRNTLESAKAVKRLLKNGRIILVTSAAHMKRSVAMFKKQGFDVIPAPTGYRTERRALSGYSFMPHIENLATSSLALSEYLSYRWYAMRGDL